MMRVVSRGTGDDRPKTVPSSSRGDVEETLTALLARHRSGDPTALNQLMLELYPSIHRIVFRLAGPTARERHEDLVQSSLEQVVRSLDGFEGRSRLTTFVFGICHRVVSRARRYDRVRSWFRREAEEVCVPSERPSPDELVAKAQAVRAAQAALSGLDGEERAAFVLHEVEDLPLEEVAVALRCSTRTVKRRLRSARQKLLVAPRPEAPS
jgi:RNA polymerase sigma-70 factor (ECF subfamily)